MLVENLKAVQRTIREAAVRSGRTEDEITLVAVSKTKPADDILTLYKAGQRDFGENYIQELRAKHEELPKDIRWHMIGHLQRNKVKYIANYISMIHSVDSFELAETIEKEAAKCGRVLPVLLEVNVAREDTKYGIFPEELPELLDRISVLPHILVRGLMTSAPLVENAEDDRGYFRQLKQLSVDMNSKNLDNVKVDTLSMGMTNDYEVAIEEGSTIVRVGTAIFGSRNYKNGD